MFNTISDGRMEIELDKFWSVLKSPPSFTSLRINTERSTVEEAKKKLQECIKKQYESRKLATPVVKEHPQLNDVLLIPNRGPVVRQKYEKQVIVDHACGCAVLRGANVFTQGIMAAPSNMQAGDSVSVYADTEGGCRMGLTKPYTGNTVYVGNGIAKYSRADIFVTSQKPRGVGIEMTEPLYEAPCLSGLLPELLFAQNIPSAIVSHMLEPPSGHVVLDMCAAPGGKTTHIATLMSNQGRVIALDKTSYKVQKIKHQCSLWAITNVEAYAFDARHCVGPNLDGAEGESPCSTLGQPPFPEAMFDRVLLDAPCSALGQRPVLACKMKANQLNSHPKLQKAIFTQAVKALKRGGILVYSTCTITTAENEEIVSWALSNYPELTLVKQTPHLGGPGIPVKGLTLEQAKLLQRFGPASLVTQQNQSAIIDSILNNSNCDATKNDDVKKDDVTKEDVKNDDVVQDDAKTHDVKNDEVTKDGVLKDLKKDTVTKEDAKNCDVTKDGTLRARTCDLDVNNDTIGFFIAKFYKS